VSTEVTGWGGSEHYLETIIREALRRGYEARVFCPARHPFLKDPAHRLPPQVKFTVLEHSLHAVSEAGPAQKGPEKERLEGGVQWMDRCRLICRGSMPRQVKILAGVVREIHQFRLLFRNKDLDLIYFGIVGCPHLAIGIRAATRAPLLGRMCIVPSDREKDCDLLHRLLEWTSFRCFDGLIANTGSTADAWGKRTGVSCDRMRVIYNGIDLREFRPQRASDQVRGEIGIPPERPVLGVTARLSLMKGHTYLIQALPQILRRVPDLCVLFVGDGPIRQQLEGQVRQLRLDEHVRFLGHREDVADITQVYDVAVLPSVMYETFGYVNIEAMASGIPEVVEDGVTGRLVAPRDPGQLAAATIDLLTDRQKARAFGEAGRRRVQQKFTLKRMLDRTFALFEELLSGRVPPEEPDCRPAQTVSAGGAG